MKDKTFLYWMHKRLEGHHRENRNLDYMQKFRSIIMTIPEDQDTPVAPPPDKEWDDLQLTLNWDQ